MIMHKRFLHLFFLVMTDADLEEQDLTQYVMDVEDKMVLSSYSAFMSRETDLDTSEYHGDAVAYIEGETDEKPVNWDEAMNVLKGEVDKQ